MSVGKEKTKAELLYKCVYDVSTAMDIANIPYVVSNGTLLGAIRDSDIIPHDLDVDFSILSIDLDKLHSFQTALGGTGFSLSVDFDGVQSPFEIIKNSPILKIKYDGEGVGDIYVFSIFNDGIARLISRGGRIVNPKLSLPHWFYINKGVARIRDCEVPTPAEPEFILERIYGSDWKTPINFSKEARVPHRHSLSGSLSDAAVEDMVELALSRGWDGNYEDYPAWPPESLYVGKSSSAASKYWPLWLKRHDFSSNDLIKDMIDFEKLASMSSFQAEHYLKLSMTRAFSAGWDLQAVKTRYWKRKSKSNS